MSKQDATAWRGTTAPERAEQRREQFLDAGRHLLATGGASSVTVRAVTREKAGVSPRFFYESFPDRDALLLTVWDEMYAELDTLVRDAIMHTEAEFAARMHAALAEVAQWLTEDPSRSRVMLAETLAVPLLRAHAQRRLPEMVLTAVSASADASVFLTLSAVDIQIGVTGLSGAVLNLFLEWTAGHLDVSADYLVDSIVEIADNALRHLLER